MRKHFDLVYITNVAEIDSQEPSVIIPFKEVIVVRVGKSICEIEYKTTKGCNTITTIPTKDFDEQLYNYCNWLDHN